MSTFNDLRFCDYNGFVAIEPKGKCCDGSANWLCRCTSCSKERIIAGPRLINPKKCPKCTCKRKSETELTLNAPYNMLKWRQRSLGFRLDTIISFKTYIDLVLRPCHYCGNIGSNEAKCKRLGLVVQHNGLDRVDNKRGYVDGNVVSCCFTCNSNKKAMTLEKFRAWICAVHERIIKEPGCTEAQSRLSLIEASSRLSLIEASSRLSLIESGLIRINRIFRVSV